MTPVVMLKQIVAFSQPLDFPLVMKPLDSQGLVCPFSLISLADMIRLSFTTYFAAEFAAKSHCQAFMLKAIESQQQGKLTDKEIEALEKDLAGCTVHCKALGLNHSLRIIEQIRSALEPKHHPVFYQEMATRLQSLWQTIYSETCEQEFVYLPPGNAKLLEKDDLFGVKVRDAFPSAIAEIKAAGNCLAADLHTAAVFHLMRTAEFGLRSLARYLKVTIPDTSLELAGWDQVIVAIQSKIDNKLKPPAGSPPPKRKISAKTKADAREFYRGVIGEFYAFKDVWRNHVMHTRASYNESEAIGAMIRVRDFMQRLSRRVSEK